jgi:hypothetical protein
VRAATASAHHFTHTYAPLIFFSFSFFFYWFIEIFTTEVPSETFHLSRDA